MKRDILCWLQAKGRWIELTKKEKSKISLCVSSRSYYSHVENGYSWRYWICSCHLEASNWKRRKNIPWSADLTIPRLTSPQQLPASQYCTCSAFHFPLQTFSAPPFAMLCKYVLNGMFTSWDLHCILARVDVPWEFPRIPGIPFLLAPFCRNNGIGSPGTYQGNSFIFLHIPLFPSYSFIFALPWTNVWFLFLDQKKEFLQFLVIPGNYFL